MSETKTLVRATLRLYRTAAADTLRGIRRTWPALAAHLGLIVVAALAAGLLAGSQTFAGGLLLGFFFAFLVAAYLSTVEAAVLQEPFHFRDLFPRAQQLFSPTISALFVLFVLNFILDRTLASEESRWLRMMANLVIAVLFNTLPETIYLVRGGFSELFGQSYAFIRENFIEWMLPWVMVLASLLLFYEPRTILGLLIIITTTNPMTMMSTGIAVGAALLRPPFFYAVPLVLLVVYVLLIFRGNLFRALGTSSRRSRAYKERMR